MSAPPMRLAPAALAALLTTAPTLARSSDAPAGPSARLDVLSINAWDLPWPFSSSRERRHRSMVEQLGRLRNCCDVVAIQELWRSRASSLVFPRPLLRPDGGDDSGLALMTARRVVSRYFHRFNERRGIEMLKHKGVFGASIDMGEVGPAFVAVVHTQAGVGDADIRRRQIEEAAASVDKWSASMPVVFLGDFNLDEEVAADRDTARWIESRGFRDAAGVGSPATWSASNPWGDGRDARYDRIYVRDGDGVRVDVLSTEVVLRSSPVSDHYGLRGALELQRTRW